MPPTVWCLWAPLLDRGTRSFGTKPVTGIKVTEIKLFEVWQLLRLSPLPPHSDWLTLCLSLTHSTFTYPMGVDVPGQLGHWVRGEGGAVELDLFPVGIPRFLLSCYGWSTPGNGWNIAAKTVIAAAAAQLYSCCPSLFFVCFAELCSHGHEQLHKSIKELSKELLQLLFLVFLPIIIIIIAVNFISTCQTRRIKCLSLTFPFPNDECANTNFVAKFEVWFLSFRKMNQIALTYVPTTSALASLCTVS